MEHLDFHTARALLDWQVELGVTEAIGDTPVDRYALEAKPARAAPDAAPEPVAPEAPTPEHTARRSAENASDLEGLRAAVTAFNGCELKRGARHTVFADGQPGARVMIIGEAPGREEDQRGLPFVGAAGQLLNQMFAAIGMSRDAPDPGAALYITNILPWRPPGNRTPSPEEIALMLPFVERHVALAKPDILVAMGNTALSGLTGSAGITRQRGQWREVWARPCLPMFHPAYLLRNPLAKREAWADLLALKARLREG